MRYVATVKDVREVVLEGRADLGYWTGRLAPLGLVPKSVDGEAEVSIGAFRTRWMGIPFGEGIVVVTTGPVHDAGDRDDYYFVRGYNSNRFFAFVERKRFKTPYRHAAVASSTGASIGFAIGDGALIRARMGGEREPLETVNVSVAAPVHLPGEARRHYHARLSGERTHYAVDADADSLSWDASKDEALACLADSGFRPTLWAVGLASTHARSRTFPGRP